MCAWASKIKKTVAEETENADADFCLINSDEGENLSFIKTLNTEKAKRITADFDPEMLTNALLSSERFNLAASFMDIDEGKNRTW